MYSLQILHSHLFFINISTTQRLAIINYAEIPLFWGNQDPFNAITSQPKLGKAHFFYWGRPPGPRRTAPVDLIICDCDRSVSIITLLDLAAWLLISYPGTRSISQLRELLRGIQIRLFDNFNHVRARFLYLTFVALGLIFVAF